MSGTSTARVATDRGERYRKQLASHFGDRIEVTESPDGTVLRWGFGGTTTLTVAPDALVMVAVADDPQTWDQVKDVTGRPAGIWSALARRTGSSLPGRSLPRPFGQVLPPRRSSWTTC